MLTTTTRVIIIILINSNNKKILSKNYDYDYDWIQRECSSIKRVFSIIIAYKFNERREKWSNSTTITQFIHSIIETNWKEQTRANGSLFVLSVNL